MTHSDLVEIGRQWMCQRSPLVITELATQGEEPDIIGFQARIKKVIAGISYSQYGNILIECKANRNDFKSDAKKPFRREPSIGVGSYRYYLTPPDLVSVSELPARWGLLEVQGKRIKIIKVGEAFPEKNTRQEQALLVSAFRRLGVSPRKKVSIMVYVIDTKSRASATFWKENEIDKNTRK